MRELRELRGAERVLHTDRIAGTPQAGAAAALDRRPAAHRLQAARTGRLRGRLADAPGPRPRYQRRSRRPATAAASGLATTQISVRVTDEQSACRDQPEPDEPRLSGPMSTGDRGRQRRDAGPAAPPRARQPESGRCAAASLGPRATIAIAIAATARERSRARRCARRRRSATVCSRRPSQRAVEPGAGALLAEQRVGESRGDHHEQRRRDRQRQRDRRASAGRRRRRPMATKGSAGIRKRGPGVPPPKGSQ